MDPLTLQNLVHSREIKELPNPGILSPEAMVLLTDDEFVVVGEARQSTIADDGRGRLCVDACFLKGLQGPLCGATAQCLGRRAHHREGINEVPLACLPESETLRTILKTCVQIRLQVAARPAIVITHLLATARRWSATNQMTEQDRPLSLQWP